MKKLVNSALIVFLLAGFAVFAWAGGSGEGKGGADDKILLQILNYADTSNANAVDANRRTWDAFEAAHPNVKLNREDSMNEQYHNKLEAYAAAGKLPDIVFAWPKGRSTTLHQNQLIKDLGPFIQRDGLDRYYLPTAIDPKEQGAGYVGELARNILPTHVFFVNLEVLNDCGLTPARTYAELKAQVPILRAKGYDCVLAANEDAWTMQSVFFSMIAGRFGGADWAQKILDGKAKFTDPDFVNALNFMKTVYDDNVILRSTLGVDYGSVPGQFANNRGAYYVDGSWRVGAFITDQSSGQALIPVERQKNIILTVFPDIESARINKSNSVQLGSGYAMSAAIPAGSPKEEAAWQLIKWLCGKEMLTYQLEIGGITVPSRTDIDVSALKLEPIQQAACNLSSQYSTGTPVIDDAFQSEVFSAVNDGLQEIAAGSKTPVQVAQQVQRAFESWQSSRR